MADPEHVKILGRGIDAWNAWRSEQPSIAPDLEGHHLDDQYLPGINLGGASLRNLTGQRINLSGASLCGADLRGADLTRADLSGASFRDANMSGEETRLIDVVANATSFVRANLSHAHLDRSSFSQGSDFTEANLSHANLEDVYLCGSILRGAILSSARLHNARLGDDFGAVDLTNSDMTGVDAESANFTGASLANAILRGAYLVNANFTRADLGGVDLSDSNLSSAQFIKTNIEAAILSDCEVFGISAWGLKGSPKYPARMTITPDNEPSAIVEDLEVSHFIQMVRGGKLRSIIDSATKRSVLILGRFSDGGREDLQAIANWLREPKNGGYLPLLFDFPRPDTKTYTETVRTMAGLSRFVIVDLSGPSVPQEIMATVDAYSIPFVPILAQERKEWSMFRDFLMKDQVLKVVRFNNRSHLLKIFFDEVIKPAEERIENRQRKLDEIYRRY